MRSQQAKTSFSGGVRTPRLTLRQDMPKYSESLVSAKNWIISPQGGATMREGFKNYGLSAEPSLPNRIFTFRLGGTDSDILVDVAANGEIHYRVDGISLASVNLHWFEQATEFEDLYFTNRQRTGIICHNNRPPYYIEPALDGSITGEHMPASRVPLVHFFDAKSPSVYHSGAAQVYTLQFRPEMVGTESVVGWTVGDRWYLIYGGKSSSNINYTPGSSAEPSEVVIAGSEFSQWSSTVATNVSAITQQLETNSWLSSYESTVEVVAIDLYNYTVTITGKNAGKVLTGGTVEAKGIHIDVDDTGQLRESGVEPAWSYPYVVHHNATLSGTSVVAAGTPDVVGTNTEFLLQLAPGDIIVLGGETHTVLSVTDDVTATLVDNHIAGSTGVITHAAYYQCIKPHESIALNEPGVGIDWKEYWIVVDEPHYWDWQHGGGNDWVIKKVYSPWDRGFPSVCVFNQQRLLLMGSPAAGTGVWGSRIADFHDFALGPQDDDPFYFDIDTSDSPTIKWAEAQRRLIIGTSSGDYVMSSNVTLTPSDVQAERQNNARSHHAAAVTINTDILYIEQGKEKIRTTGYIRDIESQTSKDISLVAEHLLRSRVKRLSLMQTPEILVFGVTEDGKMLVLSYSQIDNSGAWFEFETQGFISDIAVGYSIKTNEDELWATITYDGGTTRHIEKMPYPNRNLITRVYETDDTLIKQGIVCMDGWIQGVISENDNNVITGLGQFKGLTVACMVDDAWAGEYEVKSGTIVLESADIEETYSGDYAVGMRYESPLKTFEMIHGNQRGTGLGTKRRWNKLYVRLLDSALPIINGVLPPDRTPETLMGIAEIIRPGQQDVIVRGAGWGDGSITILQDRPYPTHCLGCYGEYSANNA